MEGQKRAKREKEAQRYLLFFASASPAIRRTFLGASASAVVSSPSRTFFSFLSPPRASSARSASMPSRSVVSFSFASTAARSDALAAATRAR